MTSLGAAGEAVVEAEETFVREQASGRAATRPPPRSTTAPAAAPPASGRPRAPGREAGAPRAAAPRFSRTRAPRHHLARLCPLSTLSEPPSGRAATRPLPRIRGALAAAPRASGRPRAPGREAKTRRGPLPQPLTAQGAGDGPGRGLARDPRLGGRAARLGRLGGTTGAPAEVRLGRCARAATALWPRRRGASKHDRAFLRCVCPVRKVGDGGCCCFGVGRGRA